MGQSFLVSVVRIPTGVRTDVFGAPIWWRPGVTGW
jgi:hypothetical protein